MSVFQLSIHEKHRQRVGLMASMNDFTVGQRKEVNAAMVVNNPCVTLYCLDDKAREAVFVELPNQIDLTKAAFVYQTQYEHAQRIFTMPYELFHTLSGNLPDMDRPIFIYITGRSGSTLLSHAFNESGLVKSLAEPDVMSQFANLHYQTDGLREHELQLLADSSLRFLFRDLHSPHAQTHAVKFRNQGTKIMDLFQAAFPKCKNLFLYRNVVDFVASFQRLRRKNNLPEKQSFTDWKKDAEIWLEGEVTRPTHYLGWVDNEISSAQQLTLYWLAVMDWYMVQRESGVPALAMNFNDLVNSPRKSLSLIFNYCGLPQGGVEAGLRAFDRDAQEGTLFAREDPLVVNQVGLSQKELKSVRKIIERHPGFGNSDDEKWGISADPYNKAPFLR